MSNETLFFLRAFTDILLVFIAARLGRSWLFGTIAINLILVGIFGAKLVTIFGLTSNAGNVFYAGVFLATYFLIENYGKEEGRKAIWLGLGSTLFFVLMSQLTVQFMGVPESVEINNAISTLFAFSLRISVASMLAYVFAQGLNIFLYEKISAWTQGKSLWLRVNASNIVSQFVDSSIFFSIALFDLPGTLLVQTILVGWLFKIAVIFMATPFIYLNKYLLKIKVE